MAVNIGRDKVTLKIEGLAELERRLQQLPEKLRRNVIREAMKEALDPVRSEASRIAPRHQPGPSHPDVGHMADNIVVSTSVTAKSASARVGPSKDHWWGLVLEYHPTNPKPFMRPAFETQKGAALSILLSRLKAGVESEASE